MKNELKTVLPAIPLSVALIAIAALTVWFVQLPKIQIEPRLPGADFAPSRNDSLSRTNPVLLGRLIVSSGRAGSLQGAWPRFRGSGGDGIDTESAGLLRKWEASGPRKLWTVEVGEGYAGAAVLAGRVFVMDYDQERREDALRCLSLADGAEIWRFSFPNVIKRNHGMSRTVPAVTDRYVVAMGPNCHVLCVDSARGELNWGLDLVQEFGATVPPWYAGQCPLVDDNVLILAPGGKDALLIAVDVETGKVIWKSPNPNGWKMTHSSIVPMSYAGKRMYVYCANRGVVGVSALDGSILWETADWRISIATIPSPVVLEDGRMFFSGGYDAGSLMLRLKEKDERFDLESVFRLGPEVFGATQHTPIYYQEHFFGIRADGQLVCLDTDGKVVWSSGSGNTFGLGPFLIADGMIYAMNDSGALSLIEASTTEFKELSKAEILDGHESWGPMSLAAGLLIARDFTRMVCLDVRGNAASN